MELSLEVLKKMILVFGKVQNGGMLKEKVPKHSEKNKHKKSPAPHQATSSMEQNYTHLFFTTFQGGANQMGKQLFVSKGNIMQWIEDYHWMIETIREAEGNSMGYAGAKVAGYGIEATMPKAAGISDPVFYEVHRRTQYSGFRIQQYKRKVSEIQQRITKVDGDREQEVLYRLLNGDSMRSISLAMRLSHTTISRIRERVVNMMVAE